MQSMGAPGRISKSALVGSTAILMSLALTGGLAYAQDNPAGSPSTPAPTVGPNTPSAAPPSTPTGNDVIVTGSRIARRDYSSATPIVTVNKQSFEQNSSPALDDTLNQLPQFQVGQNAVSQAAQGQPSATQSPGAAFLNLRGLGPNRNLVLLDGRRAQPSNATLAIDINTIPQAAIEGVEIITGGASAVYGADAISGVVNFKLRHNFAGLELDAQYGVTEHGDGREPHVSALIGFNSDRGNAMFGIDWYQHSRISTNDRDFFRRGYNDPGTNAGGYYPFLPYPGYDCGPNASFVGLAQFANCPNPAVVAGIFGAGVISPFATNYNVNPDGTLFYPTAGAAGQPAPGYTGPLAPSFKINTNAAEKGALGFNNIDNPLVSPLDRWTMFGSAHYDIADHFTAFIQGQFSETRVANNFLASPAVQFWGAAIPHDAAHPTTPELEALLNSRPDPTAPWALQIQLDNFIGNRRGDTTTNTYQVLGGLRGDVPNTDWTWEAYGSHGRTYEVVQDSGGYASTVRYQDFLALPNYGQNGTISLGSLQTAHCTSGFYGSIFQGTAPSQDCIDAISIHMKSTTDLLQNIVEANVQGGLFMLPAGQLRFSLGSTYREEEFTFSPDPLLDVTSVSDAPVGLFPTGATHGRIDVKEIYGELLVPVLSDMPFFKKLEAQLGARYSDYNTAGGHWTYKILGDWALNDFISIRGGYQLATRAPNIAELFQPHSPIVVVAAAGDPCASTTPVPWGNNASNPNRLKTQQLCADLIHKFDPTVPYTPGAPSANNFLGLFPFYFPITIDTQTGNPNLQPETAKTWTAGTVLKSPAMDGPFSRMTLSLDWYRIGIDKAIVSLTSEILYEQCLNANGSSNTSYTIAGNEFCQFIQREAGTGGNRTAIAPYFNFGSIQTSGVDAQLDWAINFADVGIGIPGSFNINAVVNWLDYYRVEAEPGAPFQDYAGTVSNGAGIGDQFKWKSFVSFTYLNPVGSLGLRWRHYPSADNGAIVNNPGTTVHGVAKHDEFDLFGAFKLNSTYELRAGIDNLLNTQPEIVGRDTGATTGNNAYGATLFEYDQIGRRFYLGVKARF